MKVGIIGSGGREHALCVSLNNSKNINKIYCIPGNAGTNSIAENITIELSDFEKTRLTIKEQNNLLGLCPKDFTIDNLENALLEKTKIEKLINIELV